MEKQLFSNRIHYSTNIMVIHSNKVLLCYLLPGIRMPFTFAFYVFWILRILFFFLTVSMKTRLISAVYKLFILFLKILNYILYLIFFNWNFMKILVFNSKLKFTIYSRQKQTLKKNYLWFCGSKTNMEV